MLVAEPPGSATFFMTSAWTATAARTN